MSPWTTHARHTHRTETIATIQLREQRLNALQRECLVAAFVDLDEGLLFKREHVHFTLGNIGPQGVHFQFIAVQTFLQERIGEKVLQLLQRVDLVEREW